MPSDPIMTLLFIGLFAAMGSTVLIVEISQWLTYQENLKHPFLKCVLTSSVLGIILAKAFAMSAHNLAAAALSIFIVAGFVLGGAVAGLLYKATGKTILPPRTRKNVD